MMRAVPVLAPAGPDQHRPHISVEYLVPFNRPYVAGNERTYVSRAIESGHLAGDGPFAQRCTALLEALLGVPKALLVTSGTHALEMAALLLDVRPGDEVIIPSFTFVSTANAFVLRGAIPRFIDIRPDTLNLDEAQLERFMTTRTRGIVAVHYAGVSCEMDAIRQVAGRHGVPVIEDNAHGLFGRYKGSSLGTLGCLAALSFHETKNITCGEGGALLINDARYIERAEVIREKGTNRTRFFRGELDKYTWIDVGSSYLLSEVLAAFLCAQLEAREEIQSRRRDIWWRYRTALEGWAATHGVGLPCVPPHCEPPSHLFHLVMPTREARGRILACLKARGILAVFHYLPLHLSEFGLRFGGRPGDCPVAEDISERLIRLPLYAGLTTQQQDLVISAILAIEP